MENLQTNKKSNGKTVGAPIHSSGGKVIGKVVNGVYVKNIKNAHMLRKFVAIASDVSALQEAERAGAESVKWTNIESGVTYCAPIDKFWTLGKPINFGFGEQLMLGLEYFEQLSDSGVTHTEVPEYKEASSTSDETKPLEYQSRATVGLVWNGEQVSK